MYNKDKYLGQFRHNKPNGCGKWVMHNGNVVPGHYVQEVLPKNEKLDVEEKVTVPVKLR